MFHLLFRYAPHIGIRFGISCPWGDFDMRKLGKRVLGNQNLVWRGWPYLFTLLICFSVGALCGFLLAFLGEPSIELENYLLDYFGLVSERELGISFFSVFWDCVRWPLFVILFGFTAFGVVLIPLVFLIRGFLLSYSVASFGVLLGDKGVAVAAVLFGISVLLILPVLFVIGCESLRAVCMRLPKSSFSGENCFKPEVLLPSIGVLAIAVALQWTLTPNLLSTACARLF